MRLMMHNNCSYREDTDMPVSTVIREKRKELGLTQEQVAQRLGVSAPAVNKWERGGTYPDITILPALARLLKTDVNTLLCFRDELSEQEIAEVCNELVKIMDKEGIEAAVEAAEQKVREYPTCAGLLQMMAAFVQGMMFMSGYAKEKEKHEEKIYSWYERAVECGKDEKAKHAAAYALAGKYMRRKDYGKAGEMLDLLPEQGADKNILKARILLEQEKKDEAAVLLERKLTEELNEIFSILSMLLDVACKEGDYERAEQIASAGEQTAVLYDQWGYSPLLLPMELAVKKKDVERSIRCIREMLKMLTERQHMSESSFYCHLYGRKDLGRKYDEALETYAEKILPLLLDEMKNSEEYEFLRENEEFQNLMKKYE